MLVQGSSETCMDHQACTAWQPFFPSCSISLMCCCSTFTFTAERLAKVGDGASLLRLVYQDSDGDWLLLQPEAPWQLFTRTVRKLVVQAHKPKKAAAAQQGAGIKAPAAAAAAPAAVKEESKAEAPKEAAAKPAAPAIKVEGAAGAGK